MRLLTCFFAAVFAFLLAACGTSNPSGSARQSIVVSPYSSLSDKELNSRYLQILLELQELNEEMDTANKARDFKSVHTKAQSGLDRAQTARRVATNFDNPTIRQKRIEAIDNIIVDLAKLAEITR